MTAKDVSARVSKFVQQVREQGLSLPAQFNAWLSSLPTVQFQALVSALLAGGTAVAYWICMLASIAVDAVAFGIWLGFVAAYGGVNYYKSFKAKRDSYRPEVQSEQNKDGAAQP